MKSLSLQSPPFLHKKMTVPYIMRHVIYSLVPVIAVSTFIFGLSAFVMILFCVLSCIVIEKIVVTLSGKEDSIHDASVILTGLLLALTLPPGLPLWIAFIGCIVSVLMGKAIFGGLGQNPFNPALVGRGFLQAAFPIALTTWSDPQIGYMNFIPSTFSFPFMKIVSSTSATPLGVMKFGHNSTSLLDLFLGNVSGSLGESSALFLLLGGAYLALRGMLNWRIPLSVFVTAFALSAVIYLLAPDKFPDPLFTLFSGGLVLGAVYMATDMVTSPITNIGAIVYGSSIAIIVIVIRYWGGLSEGVLYAILFMNALVPLINKLTKPVPFGRAKQRKGKVHGN